MPRRVILLLSLSLLLGCALVTPVQQAQREGLRTAFAHAKAWERLAAHAYATLYEAALQRRLSPQVMTQADAAYLRWQQQQDAYHVLCQTQAQYPSDPVAEATARERLAAPIIAALDELQGLVSLITPTEG